MLKFSGGESGVRTHLGVRLGRSGKGLRGPVLSPGWGTSPPHGWRKRSGLKRLRVSSGRPDRCEVCVLGLALKIPTVPQTPKPGKRPAWWCPYAALPPPAYPVVSSEGRCGLRWGGGLESPVRGASGVWGVPLCWGGVSGLQKAEVMPGAVWGCLAPNTLTL